MQTFVAAAVQIQSGPDKAANVAQAGARITEAARQGAQLVALPEVFAWRGPHARERLEAEPVPGPTTDAMAALARRLQIHLVAGSLLETRPGGSDQLPFNTTTLFGPDGSLLALYRKIHLFDVDLPGRVTVRESALRTPGSEVVSVKTALGRIGLAVCYDLRFPELFRRLADAGTEIIVIPSAFTRPTGQAHWEPLLRARAIENQAFVIAPNQYGAGALGFHDYGNSLVIDPWGAVLGRGPDDEAAVIRATLDGELLERVRRELPSLMHRRLA
ncbi:MAG TPA: carbon-nitrogen hydrolase family protein [Candidatus Binatia bacterium]|jgi:predicted amidohydrolase